MSVNNTLESTAFGDMSKMYSLLYGLRGVDERLIKLAGNHKKNNILILDQNKPIPKGKFRLNTIYGSEFPKLNRLLMKCKSMDVSEFDKAWSQVDEKDRKTLRAAFPIISQVNPTIRQEYKEDFFKTNRFLFLNSKIPVFFHTLGLTIIEQLIARKVFHRLMSVDFLKRIVKDRMTIKRQKQIKGEIEKLVKAEFPENAINTLVNDAHLVVDIEILAQLTMLISTNRQISHENMAYEHQCLHHVLNQYLNDEKAFRWYISLVDLIPPLQDPIRYGFVLEYALNNKDISLTNEEIKEYSTLLFNIKKECPDFASSMLRRKLESLFKQIKLSQNTTKQIATLEQFLKKMKGDQWQVKKEEKKRYLEGFNELDETLQNALSWMVLLSQNCQGNKIKDGKNFILNDPFTLLSGTPIYDFEKRNLVSQYITYLKNQDALISMEQTKKSIKIVFDGSFNEFNDLPQFVRDAIYYKIGSAYPNGERIKKGKENICPELLQEGKKVYEKIALEECDKIIQMIQMHNYNLYTVLHSKLKCQRDLLSTIEEKYAKSHLVKQWLKTDENNNSVKPSNNKNKEKIPPKIEIIDISANQNIVINHPEKINNINLITPIEQVKHKLYGKEMSASQAAVWCQTEIFNKIPLTVIPERISKLKVLQNAVGSKNKEGILNAYNNLDEKDRKKLGWAVWLLKSIIGQDVDGESLIQKDPLVLTWSNPDPIFHFQGGTIVEQRIIQLENQFKIDQVKNSQTPLSKQAEIAGKIHQYDMYNSLMSKLQGKHWETVAIKDAYAKDPEVKKWLKL